MCAGIKGNNEIGDWNFFISTSSVYIFAKRLLDITAAIIAIILLSPLFVVIGIMLKLDSPGPVLFKQKRCGTGGRVFEIFKFRSMVANAEQLKHEVKEKNEVSGPMFKMKNDPRVTSIGKFIRKTSIDELPQLINVLLGDMSLVGPRPPILSEVEQYEAWQRLRLSVKPGITGFWQVSARNTVSFEEMVRMDMRYIRERNLWYDLKIIAKTIPLLFGDKRC